jgi:hypothetical protein
MDSLSTNLETRHDLAQLANQPRVLVRRSLALRKGGSCVVYWMQRAMRIMDNHALDVAIEAGNLLGLPVVRAEVALDGQWANDSRKLGS